MRFTLAAPSWKELGGAEMPVVAMTRPDSEVDTEVVRAKVPCLAGLKMPESVRVAPKAGEMAEALASTRGAIGMTTMTVVEQSKGRVKAVALNGVAPTAENVQSRNYTLTRDAFLVVKGDAPAAAVRLIDFIRSRDGAQVIAANGAVPVRGE